MLHTQPLFGLAKGTEIGPEKNRSICLAAEDDGQMRRKAAHGVQNGGKKCGGGGGERGMNKMDPLKEMAKVKCELDEK